MTTIEYLQTVWHQTPGPVRTFFSAAVGVILGAWVTSRAQTKRTIVAELHALRAAQAICFSIANQALSLKRQHVRPMKEAYDATTAAHEAFMVNPKGLFELQLDLRSLAEIDFPTSALEKLIFDKCFLGGEAIATTVAITAAAGSLKSSIDLRNQLISDFRANPPADHPVRLARYLGLYADGEVDDRFRNNTDALYAQTDDCIFFAKRLSGFVLTHENQLRKKNAWLYRLPGLKLKPPRWVIAEEAGLMPNDADYANWTRGFIKDPSFTDRLKGYFGSK